MDDTVLRRVFPTKGIGGFPPLAENFLIPSHQEKSPQ